MGCQLKATRVSVDEKSQYKADGMVRFFGLKKLELLLLETQGPFSNRGSIKIQLDYHKGIYGMLAMLKCITDIFSFASIEKFNALFFFAHSRQFLF